MNVVNQEHSKPAQPELRSLWSAVAQEPFAIRFLDVDGVKTRCLEAGSGANVLILLHGIGGHLEAYQRNIHAHVEAGFHVFALDMLGHGFTAKPEHPYEIVDYLEHLHGFINKVSDRPVYLSGESLGGWVAARFAATRPQLVRRLVLNTAAGLIADPKVMERLRTLSLNAVRSPDREAVRKRLEFLMADPSVVTEDLVESRYAVYKSPDMLRAMESIMCLQNMEIRKRNMLTEEELHTIKIPTLVLWTTHDPTASVEVGQRMASAIPHAKFVVMEDCGHWPQYEDANTFNAIHIAFLLED